MAFINLPLRYIEEHPHYLDFFLTRRLCPELGLDAKALDAFPAAWHKNTARMFREAGLTCAVHLPFFDLRPGSLDKLVLQATRERLEQALSTAQIYDPAHFIAHLDYNDIVYSHFKDQWFENSLATWRRVLTQTGDAPLFLENVFETGPQHHVRMLKELGGKAGACLDLGHWHSFSKGYELGNLGEWLTALGPFRLHLHLHDNDGSADQHLGLGRGTIPWQELQAWLENRKTPVTATFEPHSREDLLATEVFLAARPLKLFGSAPLV